MKRIAIFGSREYTNEEGLYRLCRLFTRWSFGNEQITIVSGGAKGVDKLAEHYAGSSGFPIQVFTPENELLMDMQLTYKAACVIRDRRIVDVADECFVLWTESSPGTIHGIKRAYETNKPIVVIGNDGQEMTREQVEARFAELGKPMSKPKDSKAQGGLFE